MAAKAAHGRQIVVPVPRKDRVECITRNLTKSKSMSNLEKNPNQQHWTIHTECRLLHASCMFGMGRAHLLLTRPVGPRVGLC